MQSPGDMRIWPTLVFVALTTPAFADNRGLTSDEIQEQLRPFSDEIEHCYMDRTPEVRGAGHLDIVLSVSRHGVLEKLEVKTPKLATKLAKSIDTCIRAAVTTVSFPERKDWTTATVPFFFQHTWAPNTGPQYSCWNPNGCHTQAPSTPPATTANATAPNAAAARRTSLATR